MIVLIAVIVLAALFGVLGLLIDALQFLLVVGLVLLVVGAFLGFRMVKGTKP